MNIFYEGKELTKELLDMPISCLVMYQEKYERDMYIADGNLHIVERGSYE